MTWWQQRRWRVGFALCASFLSGCGAGRSFLGPQDQVAAPAAPPVVRAARTPARPVTPVVPAPVVSIAGMSEADVLRAMGEPQARSERNGRKIWTYQGAACRVEVTFFRDVTRNTYAALAHKVVQASGTTDGPCLRNGLRNDLREARRAAR